MFRSNADRLDPPVDHQHVDRPEEQKAAELSGVDTEHRQIGQRRPTRGQTQSESCRSPTPPIQVWMPNQPQATSARSSAGTLAPRMPNDGPAVHGKRNAVLRARVGIEHHRHEHDHIAEKDGEHRLPPVHALVDHARGEHVGRHAGRHRDPQHRHVAGRPPASRRGAPGPCRGCSTASRGQVGREFVDAVRDCDRGFAGHRNALEVVSVGRQKNSAKVCSEPVCRPRRVMSVSTHNWAEFSLQ